MLSFGVGVCVVSYHSGGRKTWIHIILITILNFTLTLARLLKKMYGMSWTTFVNMGVAYILQESDLVCVVNKCVDDILCRRRYCDKNCLRWTLIMKLVDFVSNLLSTDHLMSSLAISAIDFRTQSNVSYTCNVVVAAILESKKNWCKVSEVIVGCIWLLGYYMVFKWTPWRPFQSLKFKEFSTGGKCCVTGWWLYIWYDKHVVTMCKWSAPVRTWKNQTIPRANRQFLSACVSLYINITAWLIEWYDTLWLQFW